MGVITPPVGINVYVVFSVSRGLPGGDVSLESIFAGVTSFLFAIVAGIIIMTIFPQIITFLPNLSYSKACRVDKPLGMRRDDRGPSRIAFRLVRKA